jgi:hypothetical protein
VSIFDGMRRLFGRKPSAEPGQGPRVENAALPWQGRGDEETVARLAIVSLRETLLRALKDERGIHAETLMVVSGSLAGYTAAYVLWETMIKPGRLQLMRDIHVAETTDGAKYYFGDPLNAFLVPETPGNLSLYSIIAGSAADAGVPFGEMPPPDEIFGHVAKTIGHSAFGTIRAPDDHRPRLTAQQALALWPVTREILSRNDNPGFAGQSVPVAHWPIVTNIVAGQFIAQTKHVLDPRLAVRLILEAAISMSKVDPVTVAQERSPQP